MVVGVILAAGQGKRMGQPKQLLQIGGAPLVRQVAKVVCQSELQQVMVITGAYEKEVQEALAGLPLQLVANPLWSTGQSTSVQKALEVIPPTAKAVLFLLGDQPFVKPDLINRIVDTYLKTGASIVAPRCQGRRGNPVLFDLTKWKEELFTLFGDQGARRILVDHEPVIQYVEITDETIFLDVDTPEDYSKVQEIWQSEKKSDNESE